MKNNSKVIISAVIEAFIVTLLFWVVPVTENFIISYIFSLIAIAGIAGGILTLEKDSDKAIQNYAYVYTAVLYAVVSTIFSVIACIVSFNIKWTILIHAAVLAAFVIITFSVSFGNEHIERLDNIADKKHERFEEEKKTYWE